MKATRQAFGETLAKIGEDEKIVVLDADLSSSTKTIEFSKKYSDRFFNIGISEADMVGIAGGLSSEGFIPFCSSFAAFLTGRVYDQIRCTIAYSNLNVKLVATHAGLTLGEDGATHQMLEDISLMRALPNMEIYTASTPKICEYVINHIYKTKAPTYVRLYRLEVEENYESFEDDKLKKSVETGIIGKGIPKIDLENHDAVIITMGDMTGFVYNVQEKLRKEGLNVLVLDVLRLKPFNEIYLLGMLKELEKSVPIITVEDHSIYGGLGSIVSEILSKNMPRKIHMIGTKEFGRSGTPLEVLKYYGLDEQSIYEKVKKIIQR